ncbi:gephyrin-like molybdotransferase Glp [Novosphingopyxis sp.]|uniref:molybdopterin molybdotransferase MoeA n=1 Tax=Novosphingopyxis sp. TaxID=2709690 RepID=UPI003B58D181
MLAVDDAQQRILALAEPLGAETLPVAEAAGRYLAEPIAARRNQPPADNSAMDGFAIRYDDLPGPWRIVGESRAGHPFAGTVGQGEAAAISTGALVPEGADVILVREDGVRDGEHLALSGEGPGERGRHIRRAGSDFREGMVLLKAGRALTPGALALAISAGVGSVSVGRRPRLAILSTGSELAAPGSNVAAHRIYDSNGPMLTAMAAGLCADIRHVHAVEDDEAAVRAAICGASDADVLLTVGGASVGDHDHVKAALTAEGADIDFWKVAMKPGKPLIAGRLGTQALLGLPGNPGSAFVTATVFLLPLLRHLAGAGAPMPPMGQARLLADLPVGGTRTEYWRAALSAEGLQPLTGQSSGLVSSLAAADTLIPRAAGANAVKAGDLVRYIALNQGSA